MSVCSFTLLEADTFVSTLDMCSFLFLFLFVMFFVLFFWGFFICVLMVSETF